MKDMIKRTLSNGIKVYFYCDKNLKRMVASYNVNYGTYGYYDKFYYDGESCEVPKAMAHFIEHTLIEKSKYGNILTRFMDRNQEMNGITWPELTSYYFVGIKDTRESLKELIHMVDDPVFTKEDVEDVKHAIIEEVSKTNDYNYSTARHINIRNMHKDYETVYPDGNILGTRETTESITYDTVKLAYDAYYNNDNKFLVIGGNFKIDEMTDYLEEIYKDIKPHPNKLKPFDYPHIFDVEKEYDEVERPISEDHVMVSYKIKNNFKENDNMTSLYLYLFSMLKYSGETEFVTKLVQDGIIVGGIGMDSDYFNNEVTITISADVLDKDEFIKRIEGEFNSNNLDEKEFELQKRSLKVNEINQLDYIYRRILSFPTHIHFSEKLSRIDTIDKCSLDNMKKFIDKLDLSTRSIMFIKKKN